MTASGHRVKNVLVTGASSGIGLAAAERFAGAGDRVVLAARKIDLCEQAAARLRSEGAEAQAIPLDLTDTASIDRLVKSAADTIGPVDVLVSNAGLSRPWRTGDTDPSTLRAILETNLVGAQQLAARLLPAMRDAGSGDLVFVSSDVVGGPARPGMSAYTASKYALEGWVSVLQEELEGTGVRASVVRPGPTLTNHADGWDPDEMAAMFGEWFERGIVREWNLLQPEDVADAIATVVRAPAHVHLKFIEVMPATPKVEVKAQ
ncbi:SDR family NAD(P)-dependent oxidoreductase [Mycobacteroides abscessus]|uniref:SDR family NAD(P)-dependent oxidoreductase n=1 Tax=Mycobacteroides abscessus TaxID=36809 RepID=UPI000928E127|nr:SDR family NAD(P)-dependent oxidoreductase [Mycobacteroides abscessus]MDO3333892.1 SDR family NAD(P)-dependent oxidoreductase [Mycobacteroides abscessus subsp. bolletii]QSM86892.1 SDR family NAD(P)-dependent oxidoreductase [Mycobacteroides abscessus subsp. bolletii]SIB88996.1 2,3-dihydro-2,3-dihydroxybenzoate dehydrogenase [Mycobacteroides abscessus subsp. bolletii]SKS88723.1 2,3-dihydro-2,3-dihydroxybenzoate dehydrogenase [Mycobacteroides abscessus subsp. bolletii]SKT11658.1 2,3-dihydro-2,